MLPVSLMSIARLHQEALDITRHCLQQVRPHRTVGICAFVTATSALAITVKEHACRNLASWLSMDDLTRSSFGDRPVVNIYDREAKDPVSIRKNNLTRRKLMSIRSVQTS
jgi:hypothetical protein